MISRRDFLISLGLSTGLLLVAPGTLLAQKKNHKKGRGKATVPDTPRPIELEPNKANLLPNQIADKLGIPTIWDEFTFQDLKLVPANRKKPDLRKVPYQLVAVPHFKHMAAKASYTYPWVIAFLQKFSDEQYAATGKTFLVNSFVRTVQHQRDMYTPRFRKVRRHKRTKLVQVNKTNKYASRPYDENGEYNEDLISLHCRALAFDISRRGLSQGQIDWIRAKLIALKKADIGVFPIEERPKDKNGNPGGRINCWHVVVFDPIAYGLIKQSILPSHLPTLKAAPTP